MSEIDGKSFIFLPKKTVFIKTLLWTRRLHLWRASPKIFDKKAAFLSLNGEKKIFFQKDSWQCFDGHVKYCFDNPAEIFLAKRGKLFAQCPVVIEKNSFFFQKKTIFPQKSLPTLRMQFWQSHRKKFNITPKKFPSMFEKDEIFFNKQFCSESSQWHVDCYFANSAKKYWTKGRKITTECPKKIRTFFFETKVRQTVSFKKNYFSSKCSYGYVE